MIRTNALLAFALWSASACSERAVVQRFTPEGTDRRARAYLAELARGRTDSAVTRLASSLQSPNSYMELAKVGALLAKARLDSAKVVGVNSGNFAQSRHVNLIYEMRAAQGWLLVNLTTVDSAGGWAVEGIGVQPSSRSVEEITAFALRGKPIVAYLWLVVVVVCAAASLGTAVFVASRRGMPKRWLWALVSLVGIGAASYNWATGQTDVREFNVQIFSAGFVKTPFGPWILTFAFPLGAIVAWQRYTVWRQAAAGGASLSSSTPDTVAQD